MDRVTLLLLGALAVGPIPGAKPAYAEPVAATDAALDRWRDFIAQASRRFGVPEAWIRAVMQAESGGRTMLDGHPITSGAGAMGLMQMMPDTYEEMRHAHGLGSDPYDPLDNILAGAAYLRAMYDRYGYESLDDEDETFERVSIIGYFRSRYYVATCVVDAERHVRWMVRLRHFDSFESAE